MNEAQPDAGPPHTESGGAGPVRGGGGLVVLDVDGVLFRGQFMVALSRRRGLGAFLRTVLDCFLFDVGRIGLEELLRRVYGRLRGMRWQEVLSCYRSMPLTKGSAETIRALTGRGMRVVLLTAGVPDPLVKDLALRLGADAGAGMAAVVRDGRLTGEVAGELARGEGKLLWAGRMAHREGIPWSRVVAVGDDRNNLPLMRRAGMSIGFRATHLVRKAARRVVDEEDLAAILPYVMGEPSAAAHRRGSAARGDVPPFWPREVLRKTIHLSAVAVPVLADRFPLWTSAALVWCMALYLLSEFWRVNGAHIPLVHGVARWVIRRAERRVIAMGPLTLALGVLGALWGLPHRMALACILIAAVGDSISAVVGSRWGRVPWPYNPTKTVEGSAAFLVSAALCASVYLPLSSAVPVAGIATLVESLPARDWDNFLIPVMSGVASVVLLGLWA